MGRPNKVKGAPVRFHVSRDVFSEAVSFVVKLLPQRNPQPILAGVLIEASDAGLSLSAFDYEASARTTIEATVDEPGTILVHGRLLSDIASRLPNAPIQISVDDDGIVLTCGSARFTLASMPVQEYPAIPEVTGESGLVQAEEFATAISQVGFAASRDDVTPVLTGVQLEVSGTALSLVATDRYRVALREIPWDGGTVAGDETTTALVPARTLQEVGKTFSHGSDISVHFSGSGDREIIAFTSGNKTVTSLLIKGNFPPVRRLFPEQTDHYAVVNTAELAEAVRRVALVLDRSAPLRFTFTVDGVSMDASGTEQARASEAVDATLTGEDVTLGLNPQYLLEALGAVRSEFTRITFTSSENQNKLSPILITPQTSVDKGGAESFRYLLQPNLLLR